MIFANYLEPSSNNTSTFPYEANLEGALMCVYENECNYNALMKAVGISELKYYNETGKDLFIENSTAFDNFIDKAKEFFKSVIKKIKQLWDKYTAGIQSFFMDDQKFLKKYDSAIKSGFSSKKRINIEPRYVFDGSKYTDEVKDTYQVLKSELSVASAKLKNFESFNENDIQLDDIRKRIVNDNDYDGNASDFNKALKEKLLPSSSLLGFVTYNYVVTTLTKFKERYELLNKNKTDLINSIEGVIKELESIRKNHDDSIDSAKISGAIQVLKDLSNIGTVTLAIMMDCLKKCRAQARAIAIAAIRNADTSSIN